MSAVVSHAFSIYAPDEPHAENIVRDMDKVACAERHGNEVRIQPIFGQPIEMKVLARVAQNAITMSHGVKGLVESYAANEAKKAAAKAGGGKGPKVAP